MRRIAAALLTRDLSVERPVVILSGYSIDHALLAQNFFRDVGLLWYAGAGMTPETWDALPQ